LRVIERKTNTILQDENSPMAQRFEMEHSALADAEGSDRYHCKDVVEAIEGCPQCTDFRLKIKGNNSVLGNNFAINIRGK
jgi:hypothetical protein